METETREIAYVIPTDIPGLVDVTTAAGAEYRDLTLNQLRSLELRYGWSLRPVR